jgi:hypothetical protein
MIKKKTNTEKHVLIFDQILFYFLSRDTITYSKSYEINNTKTIYEVKCDLRSVQINIGV